MLCCAASRYHDLHSKGGRVLCRVMFVHVQSQQRMVKSSQIEFGSSGFAIHNTRESNKIEKSNVLHCFLSTRDGRSDLGSSNFAQ